MGYHGIAWASINGPLTGCTLKEWLRDGGGGLNRVANADRQCVDVLRDARAPGRPTAARARPPSRPSFWSGARRYATARRQAPDISAREAQRKRFSRRNEIGAWRKSMPVAHCMCCSAQIDAMVKPQFQDFAEQPPCSRVVCT
jgi:hypothetical protein